MRMTIASDHVRRLFLIAAMGSLVTGFAFAEDGPVIAKDTIQVTAFTINSYRKNYDLWSWVPQVQFRLIGRTPSGGQMYVEYTIPGGPAIKTDCKTGVVTEGRTECGGRGIPEDRASTYTGLVNFAIKMRNELAGTDATFFTGKMKVAKAHSNEHGPKFANHFVYYIDHDWNLPIGYVYLTSGAMEDWKRPNVNVAFWVRGDASAIEPHLFYQGKEVGKIFYGSDEVGKPSCTADIENNTTHYVDDSLPQKARWSRIRCGFPNILGWDKSGKTDKFPGQVGAFHVLSGNPGDYEVKVLWKNHLARSLKFTVGADGKFDNGIAQANKLGSDRVIVPVQIIGDQDGQWNKVAWKAEAFYANPLTGFTATP